MSCNKSILTKDAANATLGFVKSGKWHKKHTIPRRKYYCKECGGWHLTSMKQKKYQSTKK